MRVLVVEGDGDARGNVKIREKTLDLLGVKDVLHAFIIQHTPQNCQ